MDDDQLHRETFDPGASIFRKGELGNHAYLIASGRVEISVLRHGRKLVLGTLGEGELFGEMALIDNEVRSATAVALDATEVIPIGREQISEELQSAGPMLHLLLRVVLQRFRWSHQWMLDQVRLTDNSEAEVPSAAEVDSETEAAPGADAGFEQTRDQAVREITLIQDLREAVTRDEFALVYQPIVNLRTQATAGFETLLRWDRRAQGIMSPLQFIPVAEKSGLIGQIGLWVLEQACRTFQSFQDQFRTSCPDAPRLFIGVNVSVRQLERLGQVDQIAAVLQETGVDPTSVKLEITESLFMENPDRAVLILSRLKDLGLTIALDDFGTGYSSLSYLQRYPLDTIKIDQSFVRTILTDYESQQIVRAVLRLAQDLHMDVVAEGIEHAEELMRLVDFDCQHAQGYLFSRPLPANEVLELLKQGSHWPESFVG